jgi:hypothetical protein
MSILNYGWLGFAATPLEAALIVKDTGGFYLAVSVAYLISFLYMTWHSNTANTRKKNHIAGILSWAAFGSGLLLSSSILWVFINTVVVLLSFLVLYQLQFTSALLAQASLSVQKANTEDKKAMYASTLLAKVNYGMMDLLGFTLINEQILWLLIFYRASITLRAAIGI